MFSESDRKNKIGSLRVGKAISLKNIGNWSRNLIVKLKESFFYFYLIYENQKPYQLYKLKNAITTLQTLSFKFIITCLPFFFDE